MQTFEKGHAYSARTMFFVTGALLLCASVIWGQKSNASVLLGSPSWVGMPVQLVYYYDSGFCGEAGCSDPSCTPVYMNSDNATSKIVFYGAYGYYTDSNCTNPFPDTHLKTANCPSGQVMVGTRYYEWADWIDDEYQDAYCAQMSWTSLGSSISWVSAYNATQTLYGSYKEADCPAGQVMRGVRMYGFYSDVDEEHIDAGCSTFGGTLTGAHWVEAPNAYTKIFNDFKTALCPDGEVMIGVRWYEWNNRNDEEHTDALCAAIVPPTVNVHF